MEHWGVERWLCRYNSRVNHRLPCRRKGCINKLKNGRCGLDMCRLELNPNNNTAGNCLDFVPVGTPRPPVPKPKNILTIP